MAKKIFYLFSLSLFCITLMTVTFPGQAEAQRRRDRDYDRYDRNDRDDRYDRRRGDDERGRYERRYSRRDIEAIIRRIEENSNRFRRDLDRDLDRSNLDGSRKEDRINDDVRRFEDAFDRLRQQFNRNDSWWESRREVDTALNAARPVATRLRNNRFSSNVRGQWENLRRDLNALAERYNLSRV